MNLYSTEIEARDAYTGEMKRWAGPFVKGVSFADAEEFCRENGLGYCRVVGLFISNIFIDEDGNMTDFEHSRLN